MMRLSISHKLMLAFCGLTLLVLVATLGLARWSFERGFLDYVNATEQVRLTAISEQVGRLYLANNQQWQLIDSEDLAFVLGQFTHRMRGRGLPPPHRPPPHVNRDDSHRPPQPRPERLGNQNPPTALFDLDGEQLAGHKLRGLIEQEVSVSVQVDGEVVATLKSEPIRQVGSTIETAFSKQQWGTSLIIGAVSMLLAGLVAWWLTRLFVSPVRNMIRGVNRLSRGDYSQPLPKKYNDEFGLLTDDINYLSKTLEQNRSSRNRWLADISHELRTPLAILTGEVEALKDGIRPFGPDQLKSLDQEIQRLRYLVDDLYQLSLSDIGGLRYEFEGIDLSECVVQVINSQELAATVKGIAVVFDEKENVLISADEKRIAQLLSNLLRNALAYTNEAGRVELNLSTNNSHVVLEISDTPPGVSEEDCKLIFEPLYRKDESRSRRSAGAGLGLAICRNIVEAHRGKISAKPASLGGLQVTVELPLLTERGNI